MVNQIKEIAKNLDPQGKKELAKLAGNADREVCARGLNKKLSPQQYQKLLAASGNDTTGVKIQLAESVGKKLVKGIQQKPSGECLISIAPDERFDSCLCLFLLDLAHRLTESGKCSDIVLTVTDGTASDAFKEQIRAINGFFDSISIRFNTDVTPKSEADIPTTAEITDESIPVFPTAPVNMERTPYAPMPEQEPSQKQINNDPLLNQRYGAVSSTFNFDDIFLPTVSQISGTSADMSDGDNANEPEQKEEPISDPPVYCAECGKQIRQSSFFCGYCGAPLIDKLAYKDN